MMSFDSYSFCRTIVRHNIAISLGITFQFTVKTNGSFFSFAKIPASTDTRENELEKEKNFQKSVLYTYKDILKRMYRTSFDFTILNYRTPVSLCVKEVSKKLFFSTNYNNLESQCLKTTHTVFFLEMAHVLCKV